MSVIALNPILRRTLIAAAVLQALVSPAGAASYTWSAGSFVDGVTAPNPITGSDTLDITSGGNKFLSGLTLVNQGTVNWLAAGEPLYMSSATLDNRSLLDVRGNLVFHFYSGSAPAVVNSGTLQVATGSMLTFNPGVAFVNNAGVLNAAAGATVNYASGNASFNAGTQFTGAGVNAVTSNAAFNGAFSSSNLSLQAGTFTGAGAVISNGPVQFSGGQVSGDWMVAAGQNLSAVAGGNKFLISGSLDNQGTFAWQADGATFYLGSAAITNRSLFDVQGSTVLHHYVGNAPSFTNAATGTVHVAAGKTLKINTGVAFTNDGGILDAGAGATLDYASGNTNFNAGTQFTGAGVNAVTSNAAFNGAFSSSNLSLQAGTFTGAGAVISNGPVQFSGGQVSGDWMVAAGQNLSAVAGGNKFLISGSLDNQGTFAWQADGATFYLGSAAITNRSLFDVQGSTVLHHYVGNAPSFTNAATGTVHVAAGKTLKINTGVAFTNDGGILDTGAGASIIYNSGNATFRDGTRFTGAGGANLVTADARFIDTIHSQNLVLQSGTYTGGDGVTPGSQALLMGTVDMHGGTLAGNWQVGAAQTLNLNDGGNKYMLGATVANSGTLAWNGVADGMLYMGSTALENRSLLDVRGNLTLQHYVGDMPVFTNTAAGTAQVAAGKTLNIGVALVNDGGRLDAAAGATINYASGAATFNAGTHFTGAGMNVVTSNANFAGAFEATNLVLQSGTFIGNAAVVGGTVQYSGGSIAGDWTVASGQSLGIAPGAGKFVTGAALTNAGTVRWSTNETLHLSSSTVTNSGTLDVQTDGTWSHYSGNVPNLVNSGLLVKSGGGGSFNLDTMVVSNTGTMDVRSGVIRLPANFVNDGTLTGSGAFQTNLLTNAGHVAPGASPGALTINGNFQQTAGGSFDVELNTLAASDLLLVNGSAQLGGTLALSCWGACSFAVGQEIVVFDGTGALNGSFVSVTLSGFGSGAFDTVYDYGNARVLLRVTDTVTAVPEPATWVLWLSGLAAVGGWARRRLAV